MKSLQLSFAASLVLCAACTGAESLPQAPGSMLTQHYRAAQAAMAAHDFDTAAYQSRMYLTDALGEIAINDAHAGEYHRAASAFEQALVFAPHSSVLLLEYAEAALHGGDLDTAHALAAEVTREYPDNAKGHMLLGQTLLKQQKSAEARVQFERAATLDPTFAAGYDLAIACLDLGDEKCAASTFSAMRASYGDTAALDLVIGQAYLNSDFQNRAVEMFNAAIAKDPHLAGAHYSLAAADLLTGAGVDAAEKQLRAEIAIAPREAVAYAALGHLEQNQQHDAEAEQNLKRAVELAPDDPDAYLYLGQLYASQKRTPQAIDALRRSIALTTDVTRNNTQVQRAHYLLGRLLLQTNDADAGHEEIALAQSLMDKGLNRAREQLADYFQQPTNALGARPTPEPMPGSEVDPKAQRAAAALEQNLAPSISDSYNNLGAMAGSAGQYAEALADFRRAAEWNPQLPGLDENMGRAAYGAGQFADAVGPLSRYIATHPSDDTLGSALGISQSMTGDNSAAASTLAPLVAAGKASGQAQFVYAQTLLATGRAPLAVAALSALAAKLPQSAQVHRELGLALIVAHQPQRAAGELVTATQLDPRDARAWLALGGLQLGAGSSAAAVISLERATALAPSSAAAHRVLAAAYTAAGRTTEAAREQARAQQLAHVAPSGK